MQIQFDILYTSDKVRHLSKKNEQCAMFFVLLNLFLPSYWQEKCPDKNIQEFIALSEIELSKWSGEAQG